MEELISIQSVSKFNNQGGKILEDINAKIYEGELITIIGPSGSGKSTLLSLLNRMVDPDEGLINYKGIAYSEIDILNLRKRVGMVFQSPTMFKGSVKDNIAIGPKLHNEDISEKEIEKLLYSVDLSASIINQDVRTLSGGEKQKVSLARALANNIEVLLLDEVTASLDPDSSSEIEELIRGLHNENKTILWVTHNIEQAKKMGQYTWVMANGKFIEKGITEELFRSPKHEISKRFIKR